MIPKIQKILYATDLTPNSVYALRYTINSALKHDADIVILHVIEKVDPASNVMLDLYLPESRSQEVLDEHIAETKALIQERLRTIRETDLKDMPEFEEISISIDVCEGFPAEKILSKALALNCDTIIMGTHSKGILEYTFLGSTAKRVLRRTRKPVLIIPLPQNDTDIA